MDARMIFIEGVDRVGKGELMKAIHEATNYKHVIFDRGVISNMVYATSTGRITQELMDQYAKIESQLAMTNHLVIHLVCDTEELIKRAKETNHEHVDFENDKYLFKCHMDSTMLHVVTLDTTCNSAKMLAKMLLEGNLI